MYEVLLAQEQQICNNKAFRLLRFREDVGCGFFFDEFGFRACRGFWALINSER